MGVAQVPLRITDESIDKKQAERTQYKRGLNDASLLSEGPTIPKVLYAFAIRGMDVRTKMKGRAMFNTTPTNDGLMVETRSLTRPIFLGCDSAEKAISWLTQIRKQLEALTDVSRSNLMPPTSRCFPSA